MSKRPACCLAAVLLLVASLSPAAGIEPAGDSRGSAAATAAHPVHLRFVEKAGGEYGFDTGVLQGVLRAGGESIGLRPLVESANGTTIARGPGLFNHYRVFSRGKRHGYGARRWPSTAALRPDGAVEVVWPQTADRPFELRAVYRWSGPAVLDLETTVRAAGALPDFEVFVASYFEGAFDEARVWAAQGAADGAGPQFVTARKEIGEWLMFPRDARAVRVIQDGRWALPPSPIEWRVMPAFAQPLILRTSRTAALTVLLMGDPRECFAVSTPHGDEPHFSAYLSLFGRDLAAGETAVAHARLAVLRHATEADIRDLAARYFEADRH